MKNKVLKLCMIIFLAVLLLSGCENNKKNITNSEKELVKIGMLDSGSTYNHSGYVILDENILKYKETDYEDSSKYQDEERVGYSLSNTYSFEGIKEGETEIWVFDMIPGEIWDIKKYKISVDNKLNSRITDIENNDNGIVKCGKLDGNIDKTKVDIEDNSIARQIKIWRTPNNINIVGLKEGNTTMTVTNEDGSMNEYNINVDSNLNLTLKLK